MINRIASKVKILHRGMKHFYAEWRKPPPFRIGFNLNECGQFTNEMACGEDIVIKDVVV